MLVSGYDARLGNVGEIQMLYGRDLHEYIRGQIEERLGRRTWTWLAEQAGIPQSTLATQLAKPKFSVDVLVRIAEALEIRLGELFPPHDELPGDERESMESA